MRLAISSLLFLFFFLSSLPSGEAQKYGDFPTLQQGLLFSLGNIKGSKSLELTSSVGYFVSIKLEKHLFLNINPNLERYQHSFPEYSRWFVINDFTQDQYKKRGRFSARGWNINVPILLSLHFSRKAPVYLALGASFAIPLSSKAIWNYDVYSRQGDYGIESLTVENVEEGFAITQIEYEEVAQLGLQFNKWKWAFSFIEGRRRYNGLKSIETGQVKITLTAFYRLSGKEQL